MGDDLALRIDTFGARMCIECGMGIEENMVHFIMQCPSYGVIRNEIYNAIRLLPNNLGTKILIDPK